MFPVNETCPLPPGLPFISRLADEWFVPNHLDFSPNTGTSKRLFGPHVSIPDIHKLQPHPEHDFMTIHGRLAIG